MKPGQNKAANIARYSQSSRNILSVKNKNYRNTLKKEINLKKILINLNRRLPAQSTQNLISPFEVAKKNKLIFF